MWETITQAEHPELGIPFFQLHPCYTSELMARRPCPELLDFQPPTCPHPPPLRTRVRCAC